MNYIRDTAVEGYDDRIAYHTSDFVNTALVKQHFVDFHSITPLSARRGPIIFDVSNNSEDFINLQDMTLTLALLIKDDKGVTVKATNDVTVQNFIVQTVFERFEILANNVNINTRIGSNFGYKVIYDILDEHGKEEHEAIFSMGGYEKDTAQYLDQLVQHQVKNLGLRKRHSVTKDGKLAYFKSKLFHDICRQKKFLPNGVKLRVQSDLNSDRFNLLYPTPARGAAIKSFYISIEKAILTVPFIKLLPAYLGGYRESLKRNPDEINFMRSELISHNIPTGSSNVVIENIFQDRIPNILRLGLVDSEAYNGDNQKNSFNFKHYGVEDIRFEVDGQSVGTRHLEPNFEEEQWLDVYSNLFEGLGQGQKELPNISYDDVGGGYAIYKFVVISAPDYSTLPLRKGQTRVVIRFKTPLTSSVTLLAYTKFPAKLIIDEARNISIQP